MDYWGGTADTFSLVIWRYDRVFAGIVAVGLPKADLVALARKQQRRIAAALR